MRTPFFDAAFSVITTLGQEFICLFVICILFWCVDKKSAYMLGFSFYFSSLLIQGLKVTFRIERPWILNSALYPVESALKQATGFSFPSGHTQIATSLYSTGFVLFKKIALKILCAAIILLVALSRMYLGVHTPLDVIVSFVLSALSVFIVYKNFERLYSPKNILRISVIFFTVSFLLGIYTFILLQINLLPYNEASDLFKAVGAGFGFSLGFYLERKYIDFPEKRGGISFQVIKFSVGIAALMLLRAGMKEFFPKTHIFDVIRYFVMAVFALSVYPYIIKKYFARKDIKNAV